MITAVSLTNRPPFFAHFAATIRHELLSDGRSRVTYIYFFRARPRLLAPMLEPVMHWLLKREAQKRLCALRAYLETNQPNEHNYVEYRQSSFSAKKQ